MWFPSSLSLNTLHDLSRTCFFFSFVDVTKLKIISYKSIESLRIWSSESAPGLVKLV
jgi:hypothetical protein